MQQLEASGILEKKRGNINRQSSTLAYKIIKQTQSKKGCLHPLYANIQFYEVEPINGNIARMLVGITQVGKLYIGD